MTLRQPALGHGGNAGFDGEEHVGIVQPEPIWLRLRFI